MFFNWPQFATKRSQDLPVAYQDAGQFYFFRPAVLERTGMLITGNTIGMEVPETEVQDIDSEEDWALAEIKFAKFRTSKSRARSGGTPGA